MNAPEPRNLPTHVAFADETQHNDGRYRAVCVVSVRREDARRIEGRVRSLLDESGVSELKWKKLTGAKMRFAASKVVEYAVAGAVRGDLRIDTFVWDTEDSRNKVEGRDDRANLQRMYYRIFRAVLRGRWPRGGRWMLCPDYNSLIDWGALGDYLASAGSRREMRIDLFAPERDRRWVHDYGIHQIKEVASHESPLIQVADLFAGLAVYSRGCFLRYEQWRRLEVAEQLELFGEVGAAQVTLSASDRERCPVLHRLAERCSAHKLGVSLESRHGLETRSPRDPINFWLYRPQRASDKAPTKSERTREPYAGGYHSATALQQIGDAT